jgi:thioredoxin-dependent peroxiredoxin
MTNFPGQLCQPVGFHGATVGNCYGVELQVQFLGEIKRNAVGTLRFHDSLILSEDYVFKVLQDRRWLLEIVVPANHAVAATPIVRLGLRSEQIKHAFRAAPAEAQDDGVRQMEFVTAATLGALGLGIREDRKIVAVGGFGPPDLVVHNHALDSSSVRRDDRPLRIAQQTGMDPRKMAEVGEILHLARRVALPLERSGVHDCPLWRLQFGDWWQRFCRFFQSNPDDSVALLARIRGDARLGRNSCGIIKLRNAGAGACRVETPTMISTDKLATFHAPQRQSRAPVNAHFVKRMSLAIAIAPNNDRFAEERCAKRRRADLVAIGNGMPAPGKLLDHKDGIVVSAKGWDNLVHTRAQDWRKERLRVYALRATAGLLPAKIFPDLFNERVRPMSAAGNPFPNFSLPNQDGDTIKLSDFAGHWLVVYFYPKDDTPGCTTQGRSFTATRAEFDAEDIQIVGVSQDDVASHKNFHHKFAFAIDLLSDTSADLMKKLGLGQSEWKGTKYWERTTFVIDPKGMIRKVYEKVDPEGHEKVLLDDIRGLKAGGAQVA